jgi:hypothetical protein
MATTHHSSQAKKTLLNLTDVFTGADGGVDFVKVREFIYEMARRADLGDADALKVLGVMYSFERLVELGKES